MKPLFRKTSGFASSWWENFEARIRTNVYSATPFRRIHSGPQITVWRPKWSTARSPYRPTISPSIAGSGKGCARIWALPGRRELSASVINVSENFAIVMSVLHRQYRGGEIKERRRELALSFGMGSAQSLSPCGTSPEAPMSRLGIRSSPARLTSLVPGQPDGRYRCRDRARQYVQLL